MRRLTLIIISCTLLLTTRGHAQDLQQSEAQADRWAQELVYQGKALGGYLACIRQTRDKVTIMRLVDKAVDVLRKRGTLLSRDALVIDSILEEVRPIIGEDVLHYLPLLEGRIIHSGNASGKYLREFQLMKEALKLRKSNNLLQGDSYEQLLRKYISMLLYKREMPNEQKLAIYEELWQVYRTNHPGLDSLDINLLDRYISQCVLGRAQQKAVGLYELKKQYISLKYGTESKEYMDILRNLAVSYSSLNLALHPNGSTSLTPELEKEIAYRTELLQLQQQMGLEMQYSDVLILTNELTINKQDTLSARQIAQSYVEQMEQMHGKETESFCMALDCLVKTYPAGDAETIPLLEELISLQEKVFGKDSPYYAASQAMLTLAYSRNHLMQAAIDRQRVATQADDIQNLSQLAIHQSQYAQYREAIETYEKMLDYCATHADTNIYLFTSALGAINCYGKLKDTDGLLTFGKKWCNDTRYDANSRFFMLQMVVSAASQPDKCSEDVLQFVDNYIMAHPEAMDAVNSRAEIMEQKATVLLGLMRYEQAATILREIILQLQGANADIRNILKYQLQLEVCLIAQERLDEALDLNQSNLRQLQQLAGYDTMSEYLSLCCRAAILQDKKDHFDEVLRLCGIIDKFDGANAIQLDSTATFNFSTFAMLTRLMDASTVDNARYRALCMKGLKTEAEKRMIQQAVKTKDLIRFTLSRMDTTPANTAIWTRQANDNLCNVALLTESDSLAMLSFDFTLLYKQAFLTAKNLMRQQLLESGNAEFIAKYEELQNMRQVVQQGETLGLDLGVYTERCNQLEAQLVEDSKIYGDFTRKLNLKWTDIQETLGSQDMAIEFVAYTSFDDQQEHLAALLIRKEWQTPKLLHLFAKSQIPENIYTSPTLSRMCWEPMTPYLKGIKNIYFAPAGELYNIGIESLPSPDNQGLISEKYNLYRISSTRELVGRSHETPAPTQDAVIYGGLLYDASTDELIADAQRYSGSTAQTRSSGDVLRSVRGQIEAIEYLPATKVEAESIAQMINQKRGDTATRLFEGAAGTEASFKALSGKALRLAHLSTHGFYDQLPVDNSRASSSFFLLPQETEDKALSRSGLLFAGAENTLQGEPTPNGVDDGVLTAFEISLMDFRGMDLIALSACQTAQGDITSDGVFGLQRGFKKAGANSILMSLWKVDDEATCLLMTEFYRNWLDGKSKHDALEAAKQTVRSHPGWEGPRYWAAFILLDGVD